MATKKRAPVDRGQMTLQEAIAEAEYVPPLWLTNCNACLHGDHANCDAWELQFCHCRRDGHVLDTAATGVVWMAV